MPAATTSAKPLLTRKPVVRPHADGSFDVTFPCGGRISVLPATNRDGSAGWWVRVVGDDGEPTSVRVPSYAGEGYAASAEDALSYGWAAAFREASLPTWGSAAEVHALALVCDDDTSTFAKTVKRIARERFGAVLNASRGRGTGSGWVHVQARGDKPTPAEMVALSMVDPYGQGRPSIRPCGGERVAVICRLAGHPLPEGFKVQAPQWD